MANKTFEDMICWQQSKQLSIDIYKTFSLIKDFGFRDQIQRASVSVMNNIAEGYERGTQKELKYFLFIAKGSCGEVRSMLILAKELSYINNEEFEKLYETSLGTSKLIGGFIRKLTR